MTVDPRLLRTSHSFPPQVIQEIHRAADQGVYEIRGFGAKRKLPTFDDLVLLGASISRYPLEGYRERCDTNVVLGTRFAQKPIELKIPITIAGMFFKSGGVVDGVHIGPYRVLLAPVADLQMPVARFALIGAKRAVRAFDQKVGAYISERKIIDRQMLGFEHEEGLETIDNDRAAEFRPHSLGRRLRMDHVSADGE